MEIRETTANEAVFGQDARKVKENNRYTQYYQMENAYGRLVPVAIELVSEKLKKGYTHTDRKIYVDNPADRVKSTPVESPLERVANLVEALADIKEVKKKSKKVETEEETV